MAAQQLESKEGGKNPALVKTFNTILLELTLIGKHEIDVKEESAKGNLPQNFAKLGSKRKYYSCVLVDFIFRGIPQRMGQQAHYTFGGRAEVTFKGYALNEDELKKFEEELGKSDVNDVLALIEGTTTESMGQLQEEINFFLEEKEDEEKKEKPKDDSNPFFALIGKYDKKEERKGKKKTTIIKPDNFIEAEHIRPLAAEGAKETSFNLFDIYKKSHGMPSYT